MKEKLLTGVVWILSLNIVILLLVLVSGIDSKMLLIDRDKEIIFISSTVIRTSEFEKSLPKNAEIVYLSGQKSGIKQMTEYLAARKEIDAIRIISHGNEGYFDLDGEMIDSKYIAENGDIFRKWGKALSENADIMLYGCKVAATDEGKALVKKLAELTGADVAAATELVGGLLANWTLDYKTGNIETAVLKIEDYEFHLDREVTSNADSGPGTLRQAILDAEDWGETIYFNLEPGSETITLTSELLITKNIRIEGYNYDYYSGSGTNLTISGDTITRIFNIEDGVEEVVLNNLNIIDGRSASGAGIYVDYNSKVTINNCNISGCIATEYGGGIYVENNSQVAINNCNISNNSAADGGGVHAYQTTVTINNSTISGNVSTTFVAGGGLSLGRNRDPKEIGSYTINNSTISKNTSLYIGGGICCQTGYLSLKNTIVAGNFTAWDSSVEGVDLFVVNITDNGNNIIENSWQDAIHYGFSATSILYNTRYGSSSEYFHAWSRGGTELSNQNLNIASALADNGGPTQTLAISKGSFAIGAGVYDATLITDQRGEDRHSLPTIGAYEPAYSIWAGTSSTDWSTASNWESSISPKSNYDVFIPNVTNDPIISTSVECSELIIASGANLRIAPTGTLKVNDIIENNNGTAGLVLESDNTGTGKLVNNTEGVQATVQQYIVKDQWHYVSSPISDLTDVNTVFNKFYLIKNDESLGIDNPWVYLEQGEGMNRGKGYGVMWDRSHKPEEEGYTDQTVSFAGALNTGFVSPIISYSGADRGWNLVGNPYPCTIDWVSVTKTLIDGAVYVYNPTTNNYSSYVDETQINGGSRYIAPMQGFFVRATDIDGWISFTNDVKTTESSTFKSATVQSILRLALSDASGATDESVIRIHPAATEAFDGKLDAYKLKATASATPQLYSVLNGDEYSINSIPEATVNTVIPFELLVKTTGTQQIAATELRGLDATLDVVLEDLQTGARTLLANSAYRFSATAGETRKFNLLFADATSVSRVEARTIKAYGAENRMCISNMSDGRNIVAVYNLNGQLVHQTNAEGSYTEVELPNGLYVVKVTPENGNVFNGKVRIGSFK